MLITVTNLSATEEVFVSAARKTLVGSEAFTFSRSQSEYDAETQLKALVAAGSVSVSFVAESTDEVANGELVVSPGPTSLGVSDLFIVRKAFTAGVTGAADDVSVMVANAPFAFRIVDAVLYVVDNKAGETVTLRTAAAGAGSALTDALSVNATGVVRNTALTTTQTVAEGGSLYLRRSDRDCAGELVLFIIKQ